MKGIGFITFFLLVACLNATSQLAFQTIVTRGPVEVGESFQVQYVLEESAEGSEFFAPDFKEFRFVSGPNIYTGSKAGINGPQRLKNIVFTLAPLAPGKFVIPGASARIGNKLIKSDDAWLLVTRQTDSPQGKKPGTADPDLNDDRFLSAAEDPYKKIRRNLFIKVMVDKTTCFVGEPVTATFKLYSRLDSKSDIVKNPGFYGFTVQDMINLDNKLTGTETINGKNFDVHTVRKVQLYPLQAGTFHIDPMEVHNKIRFSKSAVHKKAEQEIVEGVFPDNDKPAVDNTAEFESDMATEVLAINVKPSPPKNKPEDYNGATGSFVISSSLTRNEVGKNEEGELVITIRGKGNFTQLSAPVVRWPAAMEGFDPTIKDFLDHSQSPLHGRREFHFRFVSAKPGTYALPAFNFSFFNPDSNKYQTASSRAMNVTIVDAKKAVATVKSENKKPVVNDHHWKWWILGGIAVLGLICLSLWFRKNKEIARTDEAPGKLSSALAVDDALQVASTFYEADERTFYQALRNGVWECFTRHLGLTGSKMNKVSLAQALESKKVDKTSQVAILKILDQCETGIFTNAGELGDHKILLEETRSVLLNIISELAR